MTLLKSFSKNLTVSLCEIVIGILLIIDPVKFISGILIALGIVLIALGVENIIVHFNSEPEFAVSNNKLSMGLVYIAIGLFLSIRHKWLIESFSILTFIYGAVILFVGFIKIQWTVDFIRLKRKQWILALISSLFSVVSAVIILANPFESTEILWTFSGVSLIIQAVLDIVTIFIKSKRYSR